MRAARRRVRRGESSAGEATRSNISGRSTLGVRSNQRNESTDGGEATTNATSHAEVERQLFVN